MRDIPILFVNKEDCCACGACVNACPKKAISYVEDETGFMYPVIDKNKCVMCGKCIKVCSFKYIEEENRPVKCYAAYNKNVEITDYSASAGIFSLIALRILESEGICFGATIDADFKVHHISINNSNDLWKLQGSKYVQSNTLATFSEAKKYLNSGKKVLYSGTPCQISGLKGYLGKEYDNLFTIDIVCHGVPSWKMFRDYLNEIEKHYNGKIQKYNFRDKTLGWGKNGSVIIQNKKHYVWESASPYMYYFSRGVISRDSCYNCKYTCDRRPGDITIGDYWGIEKQHPEVLKRYGWNEKKGISLVITNTKKGETLLKDIPVELVVSDFEKMASSNHQLSKPCDIAGRDNVIDTYVSNGWGAVTDRFYKKIGLRKYTALVKSIIPPKIKMVLKNLLHSG